MIMRKRAWPVAASLLLSIAPVTATFAAAPASAAAARAAVTLAQAEQIAVRTFNIPAYYKVTQESFNSAGQGNPASYGLTFGFTTPTQQQQFISVSVAAATGAILSYNRPSLQNTFVYPVPVSASQAEVKAVAWVKKLYPNLYSQVQVQPLSPQMGSLTQAVQYNFNFVRMVDGVQAPFNGIAVTIDQNGNLTNVNESWSNVMFPAAHPALSYAQANAAYAAGLPLELSYQNNWQATNGPAIVLAYSLSVGQYPQFWGGQFMNQGNGLGIPVIDAQTGKVVDASGAVHPLTPGKNPAPLVQGGPHAPFLTRKVNWTQAQALAYASRVEHVPAAYRLTSQNEFQNLPSGDVVWNFTWTYGTGGNLQYNAQVDATYGFLQSFYSGGGPYRGKARYSQAHMATVVKQFLERLFPQDTGAISVAPNAFKKFPADVMQDYSLEFMMNGLPDGANTGNITASAVTGQISNFSSPLQQGETGPFPDPAKAISPTLAKRTWLQAEPLQLMYLQTQPASYQKSGQTQKQNAPAHVVLVYAPVGPYANGGMVDALTGKMLGGQTPSAFSGVIKDIAGTPAAPEIRLLVNHGLLPVSAAGDVHPNRVMTRAQFIQLVSGALNFGQNGPQPLIYASKQIQGSMADVTSSSPAFSAILSAYESGILPAGALFEPNRPTSRGFAANVLARALGYGAILAHPQAFRLPAKDAASIPKSEYAAATICYSLGMFSLVNGNFDASSGVTVAQAAVSIVYGVDALAQKQRQIVQTGMGY